MLTSWFSSVSEPSPRDIPTEVAIWFGVKPSNQAA